MTTIKPAVGHAAISSQVLICKYKIKFARFLQLQCVWSIKWNITIHYVCRHCRVCIDFTGGTTCCRNRRANERKSVANLWCENEFCFYSHRVRQREIAADAMCDKTAGWENGKSPRGIADQAQIDCKKKKVSIFECKQVSAAMNFLQILFFFFLYIYWKKTRNWHATDTRSSFLFSRDIGGAGGVEPRG